MIHKKFIIGHIRPNFNNLNNFDYVSLPDCLSSPEFQTNKFNNKIFNEYSFLFFLLDQYREGKLNCELVTLSHYRRFVFNKCLGPRSTNNFHNFCISPVEFNNIEIDNYVLPVKYNLLISTPLLLTDDIMSQYHKSHYIRDILMFCADMVDSELFDDNFAYNLLRGNLLIPSPLCGTFPLSFIMEIADIIEKAAFFFWNKSFKNYKDAYQQRAMAFVLERLNSLLLVSKINQINIDLKDILGFTTVVTPGREITSSANY